MEQPTNSHNASYAVDLPAMEDLVASLPADQPPVLAPQQTFQRDRPPQHVPVIELGKLPPQAIEFEEAVLGACMVERNVYPEISPLISEDDFYREAHQKIWKAMSDLSAKGEPIDILTVTAQLRKNGHLQIVGGPGVIAELSAKVNSGLNTEYHARIITQQSFKRSLIEIAHRTANDCYDEGKDVFEIYDSLSSAIIAVENGKLTGSDPSVNSQVDDAMNTILDENGEVNGVPSAYDSLNRFIYCYENQSLIIVAARPATGKSVHMINEVVAIADSGKHVAAFSLEMSAKQQINRALSLSASVSFESIRTRRTTAAEKERLAAASARIKSYKMKIYDDPSATVGQIRSRLRRLKLKGELDIAFIDYLGLIKGMAKSQNRNEEIGTMCRELKILAKSLDIPIVLYCQLSRNSGTDIPQLHHLRDSGEIEQHADMVMFLHRPEIFGHMTDEAGESLAGVIFFCIRKNRFGKLGDIKMTFAGDYTRISERPTMILPPSRFKEPDVELSDHKRPPY